MCSSDLLIVLTAAVAVLGALVYLGLCMLFKVEEVRLVGQVWRRIRFPRKVKVPPAIENGHTGSPLA